METSNEKQINNGEYHSLGYLAHLLAMFYIGKCSGCSVN